MIFELKMSPTFYAFNTFPQLLLKALFFSAYKSNPKSNIQIQQITLLTIEADKLSNLVIKG